MSATLSLTPGTIVEGHYVIGSLINRGGFGAVYRGIDMSENNRPCAIKETYDVTPAARRQALMEVAVLFTINSSHLPQVFDAFEDNGRFYVVMQLIEGQNLLEIMHLRGMPCSEEEVLRWLLPIADVLNELHSRHPAVMHRDIKPGNIIITPNQMAVLVDFGLTKLYNPDVDTQTNVRAVSEGFSPIEQYLGKTTPQSDIYSLAATMYFLLTSQVPPAAIQRSVHDTLVPPRQLNPRISPRVEQALLTALALHADYRYASMSDFASALQSFQPPQVPLKLARQPVFNGYADRTIAGTPIDGGSSTQAGTPPAIPSTILARPATPVAPPPPQQSLQPQGSSPGAKQRKPGRPFGKGTPAAPGNGTNAPAYPFLPPHPNFAPQAPIVPIYKSLPSPQNQGCLWGLLQGVLAALLVISAFSFATLKNPGDVYMAIIEGLFLYMVAGFFTTRKGGSALRGIWAGLWAGITSTIIFWIVLAIGLTIQLGRYLQQHPYAGPPTGQASALGNALSIALQQVTSLLFGHATTRQGNNGLVVYLVAGLVCAMATGLLGGLLGAARFRSRMRKKGYAV